MPEWGVRAPGWCSTSNAPSCVCVRCSPCLYRAIRTVLSDVILRGRACERQVCACGITGGIGAGKDKRPGRLRIPASHPSLLTLAIDCPPPEYLGHRSKSSFSHLLQFPLSKELVSPTGFEPARAFAQK